MFLRGLHFQHVTDSRRLRNSDAQIGDSGQRPRLLSRAPAAAAAFIAAILAVISAGCGSNDRPALGQVHGRVTLDGEPLAHAEVVFRPESGARDSSGATNADGEYRLKYIRDDLGAAVGKNSVRISTMRNYDPKTERVPEEYNKKTELVREVTSGDNKIDFDLITPPPK